MTRRRAVTAMTRVALLVSGLAWLYPLFWELPEERRRLLHRRAHFLWANYLNAWQEASFGWYFMNTILIT